MQSMEMDTDILRLQQMEQYFDVLYAAVKDREMNDDATEAARMLEAYYTGGQWLSDYEREERGGWPAQMKRGVLSQDGLYDLLAQLDGITERV